MTYLLDTNACIDYLTARQPRLSEHLRGVAIDQVALCSVVKAELVFGARKSARVDENLKRLEEFFAPFQSFAFDDDVAVAYGAIRASLEQAGTPIGANDLMIAATAIRHRLTVVTRNTGEFSRVPGLLIENWAD